jgi:hypothetical protein
MSFHGMGSGEGGENFLVMVESSEGTRGGVEDKKTFYLFIYLSWHATSNIFKIKNKPLVT